MGHFLPTTCSLYVPCPQVNHRYPSKPRAKRNRGRWAEPGTEVIFSPYILPVTSGRGPGSGKDGWDNPEERDIGPIPPGRYALNVRDFSDPSSIWDLLRNQRADWGDWRVRLRRNADGRYPNREGFHLHGGARPGSAGCIDVGGGFFGNAATDRLNGDILADPGGIVPLEVFQ
jgi:hypothetical protein